MAINSSFINYLRQNCGRLVFTAAYTLVVLPFTVKFFQDIATPSLNDKFLWFSLSQVYILSLPVFLACLEYVSVQLSCMFWQNKQRLRQILILCVFVLCQSFTMFSTSYDIRNNDFDKVKKQEVKPIDSQKKNIEALKAQLNVISSRINEDQNSLESLRRKKSTYSRNRSIKQLQDSIEADRNSRKKIQELLDTSNTFIAKVLGGSYGGEEKSDIFETNIDYIVKNIFTTKSFLSAFLVLLFPVSVLGVGFMLANEGSGSNDKGHPNLNKELEIGESLPEGAQLSFAKNLEGIILAKMTGLKAEKEWVIESAKFHLENERVLKIAEELSLLRAQVFLSKLDGEAKQHLMNYIDRLGKETIFQ